MNTVKKPVPKGQPDSKAYTGEDVNNSLVLGGEQLQGISFEEAFDLLENTPIEKLKDLTVEYFKFEQFGQYDFLFTGLSTATIDGREMPVVEITSKENKKYICGATVLVGALSKVTQVPCYFRAVYEKDTKNKVGTYKDIKVYVFPTSVE